MEKIPMTEEGQKKLLEELKHLKTVERPIIIKAIADARSNGDLSENAEYHAAREKQSFIEGRVAEIESTIALNITRQTLISSQNQVITMKKKKVEK